ncbi:hypothetical protein [Thiolapillus sp.]
MNKQILAITGMAALSLSLGACDPNSENDAKLKKGLFPKWSG